MREQQCPACHEVRIREVDKFCPTCGYMLEGNCPQCGESLKEYGSRERILTFCPECGKQIDPLPQENNDSGSFIRCTSCGADVQLEEYELRRCDSCPGLHPVWVITLKNGVRIRVVQTCDQEEKDRVTVPQSTC